ncbi:N-acetylglutamate kinase [Synechocystis sp. PCC 6803]|jgi:acetylglutamate kinase|uniref:Acetylglutamate kinase n=1 Tax=Synechocystis sp. (strain ATCC 27184 / PCC 6803 / Kazusa) TaxID=1111708 RepID=ARGB_SYNY3|nr:MULTISPECIES: acetylglutamate kinase [unclassified Synechocystis]P73326.1 RecName: Full=Acetylglutamate kinase; AltName: Full=N-acetyl-L-glutamate 5-phosphotransferase; AltName: Full=NAG kinase; Short=NAGK [Synechocystis sp. PCC 6803 substr. Kazusa]BAM51080.1 acetylglutamate kinase [Synechocystis sp. PCC 6803] [Bacillus subtilis BEST7613]ALJ67082.1 acetylglutamate kinase [Synechocystis sp. PCC 6803]AVP88927.1 acetylglutamate kinase [Synechocystis sp. IPPAS B-1465]MBD2617451.1 acetylglutamat
MSSTQDYIGEEAATRVKILSEALPYIQHFAGRTVVVKYGGAAMKDSNLKDKVIRDIVFMASVGIRPVVVHGGGPEINTWLDKVGIEPQFKDGLRVTDAATMDIVEMVLVGRVNKELVNLINQAGGKAVGLCGKDGQLMTARTMTNKDVGFVGEVSSVDARVVETLVKSGYIPVISSVAADEFGQAHNINADTCAGELAAALGAEKLILLTDTRGILRDYKDPSTLIHKLDIQQARELIGSGIVAGGMIPKVTCCVRSLAQGVRAAHILDGRLPHALLLEVFTDLGIGSMIVASGYDL